MATITISRNVRSRAIRIAVYPDQRVRVTAPVWFSDRAVQSFIASKHAWITAALAKFAAMTGATVIPSSTKTYKANRAAALQLITERVNFFKTQYNVTPARIMVRDQRSRWGSCSKKGSLSFNYKVLFLPTELQDYIIVHELCHLREFNHSPRFWALVAKAVPGYKAVRKRLRHDIAIG